MPWDILTHWTASSFLFFIHCAPAYVDPVFENHATSFQAPTPTIHNSFSQPRPLKNRSNANASPIGDYPAQKGIR